MKGFTRTGDPFFLCGLNCALCSMHLGGCCRLRRRGRWQSCTIAGCSLAHGWVQFCWECPGTPVTATRDLTTEIPFVPHRNRQQDIAQAQELGLEAILPS